MKTSGAPALNRGEQPTCIVTAGGLGRSGKGTSMAALRERLLQSGQRVESVDQGIKFRAMGSVATAARQPLDSPAVLNDFIQSPATQKSMLAVLKEVSVMGEADKKARLYTPELSKASGKVGRVPAAHEVAVRLLRTQVEEAVEAETNVILIDGRSMEKHAKQFTEDGLGQFIMGWYFRCDPVIAARRSLGLFAEFEGLAPEERERLLAETLNISDRNRSDTLREVDPLREPVRAYHLDLSTYHQTDADVPYKRTHDILHGSGIAVVDTSYTNSIDEMTGPIVELSMLALMLRGPLSHQDVGIEFAGRP